MAKTVYTLNGKVLTNSANDKWLQKKEAPAGFVMNASNAEFTLNAGGAYWVQWKAPAYPDTYNGNGKQYIFVNNNSTAASNPLMYGTNNGNSGPNAINSMSSLGTSTGELLNNPAAGGGYGVYFVWPNPINATTLEQIQAYFANVSITIVDP